QLIKRVLSEKVERCSEKYVLQGGSAAILPHLPVRNLSISIDYLLARLGEGNMELTCGFSRIYEAPLQAP
ncbi:MAG: hypothetical protein O6934_10670, partial [SAR324 cluster bacterium]|nr:hypothetical protein [SAR324 cluster bacterium]